MLRKLAPQSQPRGSVQAAQVADGVGQSCL